MTKVVLLVTSRRVTEIVGQLSVDGRAEADLAHQVWKSWRGRLPIDLGGRSRRVLAIHDDTKPGMVMLDVDV